MQFRMGVPTVPTFLTIKIFFHTHIKFTILCIYQYKIWLFKWASTLGTVGTLKTEENLHLFLPTKHYPQALLSKHSYTDYVKSSSF